MSLTNVGNRQFELGRSDEALAPVEEAATIRRQLTEADLAASARCRRPDE